jgi:DNA mismatch repair protein MutL
MHIANQISAGEVVQRPESAVKELVENAVDSGADHITVILGKSGKALIQVIDNGSGMGEADALLAFERHATSKISEFEDLERIHTFGFRGEALPSIASVSKVEIKTRREEDELATMLRIEGGSLEEQTKVQAPLGTSVSVKNLFFNTPARRQFMKSDQTEYRHIANTVQRYILSHPDVHFTFISDGSAVYDIPAAPLPERIKHLFGDKVASSLIEVSEDTDLLTVSGFVGRPNFAKRSRGDQFLFVNGRYITSRMLNHAIFSTYENMIESGEFPMYMIFLNVNPKEVDVNVHPSKLEVKFNNERNIYTILNTVIRQSLFKHDLTPNLNFQDDIRQSGDFDRTRLSQPEERMHSPQPKYDSYASLAGSADAQGRPVAPQQGERLDADGVSELFESIERQADGSPLQAGDKSEGETIIMPSEQPLSETQFVWQLHNKYIFTTIKSGLMIIDQHVAHERILYEKGLHALQHSSPFSQQLLFTHSFRVTPGDFSLLEELLPDLRAMGFVISLSAPNFVNVEAVPQDVRVGKEESILEEMIEQYKEYDASGVFDERHNIAASYGCRAAIKAGDKLSPQEIQSLIDQLFATSNPYVCPHGRPVIIKLSLEDLDKRFGRT